VEFPVSPTASHKEREMNECLVDSDVFIDFLRGRMEAIEFIQAQFPHVHVSAITVAELFSGVRDGKERVFLEEALGSCNIHDVTQSVAMDRR